MFCIGVYVLCGGVFCVGVCCVFGVFDIVNFVLFVVCEKYVFVLYVCEVCVCVVCVCVCLVYV